LKQIRNLFENTIQKSYVINLKDSIYRHNHVVNEFAKYSISNFIIENAVTRLDKEVKKKYEKNEVVFYPPCFRCGYKICNHENNIITPSQVANFLSFRQIMKKVANKNNGLYAVFEDDFYFKENTKRSFTKINKMIIKNHLKTTKLPVIIRIGSHSLPTRKEKLLNQYFGYSAVTENEYNMANPCFIFNKQFADLFLRKFNKIEVTSDTFIHKVLCENNQVLNYSIKPFPIGQHSHGKKSNFFDSQIVEGNNADESIVKARSKRDYLDLLHEWFQI
jgi:GR25 family glycosyltransferase involved in LPS biosynthesis